MKEKIKNFIKRCSGEVMIIIGTGLFVYNVFDFSYTASYGHCVLPMFSCEEILGVGYYYPFNTLLSISIGAMLIVSGVLIIRNKYEKKD